MIVILMKYFGKGAKLMFFWHMFYFASKYYISFFSCKFNIF